MEEKRKITSGNKIPGCERLTRPEEIQGLSKYLGAIRDTQEQWISENMPDSPLEGPEDAKIKTIKLPDKRIKLDGTKEVVLPEGKEGLDIPDTKLKPDVIGLEVSDPKLKTDLVRFSPNEIKELPKSLSRIKPSEPDSLPGGKDKLRNVEDPKLRPGKERLVIEGEPSELPDSILKIGPVSDPELPKDKLKIHPSDPNISLPNSKSTLNNIPNPELPSKLIELQDTREIKLSSEMVGISIESPSELPSTRLDISPTEPDDLRQHIENLFADEPSSLRQKQLGLHITEPDKLPWEVLEIDPKDIKSLPSDRLDINPRSPENLPSDRLDISPTEPELPNSRIDISPTEPELPDSRLDISPTEPEELPKESLTLDIPDIKRIEKVLDSMSADELYEEVMKLLVSGKSGAETIGHGNLELAGIISAYLGNKVLTEDRAQEVSGKIADLLEKQKKLLFMANTVGSERKDKEFTMKEKASGKKLDVPEKDTISSDYLDKEYRQRYGEENRVSRIKYQVSENEDPLRNPSSFLNPALYDQDRYIRRLAELAADSGSSVIGNLPGVALNTDKISSAGREYILKNTLMALVIARNKLEKITGTDRSRLPGDGAIMDGVQSLVQGGVTGLLGGGIESAIRRGLNSIAPFVDGIFSGIDTSRPQNKPSGNRNILTGEVEETKTEKLKRLNSESIASAARKQIDSQQSIIDSLSNSLKNTNNAISETISNIGKNITRTVGNIVVRENPEQQLEGLKKARNFLQDKLKDANKDLEAIKKRRDVVFSTSDYFAGKGIELTLKDLCPKTNPKDINTLEDFRETLVNSPYITTPWKLMKRPDGNLTLDSNAYWEVVIEPFVDDFENGGWSYLPSIHEINTENRVQHNHLTRYSSWIPINGFELQKSKLVSKSLGLFDGEINYPVSVEYTNELRISVVDDQYKSWRRYFQKCADVATYFSEAHDAFFYMDSGNTYEATPTAIDKNMICISHYKNITFRIRVYCMTPQYSTIKKFDLLCVMKDFSEEYSGEIEGGGQDLSISFSIVGENPDDLSISLDRILTTLLKEAEDMMDMKLEEIDAEIKEDLNKQINTILNDTV